MKKVLLAILLGSALFSVVYLVGGERIFFRSSSPNSSEEAGIPSSSETQNSQSSVGASSSSTSHGLEDASGGSPSGTEPVATDVASREKELAARSVYFPNAPEMSRWEKVTPEGKEVRRIVKTNLSQPYVEIRERIVTREGQDIVVSQDAMVANQVLLPKPEGEWEVTKQKLFSLGAKNVQEKGNSILVTFESNPKNPRALEEFLQLVKQAFPQIPAVEPNYIRKLFSIE